MEKEYAQRLAHMEAEYEDRLTAIEEWLGMLQATTDRHSRKLNTGALRLKTSIDTMESLMTKMGQQGEEAPVLARLDPETIKRAGAGRTFLNPFTPLVSQLAKSFDLQELAGLAHDVDIDIEELDGSGKLDTCRRLVAYAMRREKLDSLLEVAAKERPEVNWKELRVAPDESPRDE
jgi:hypothetical protein